MNTVLPETKWILVVDDQPIARQGLRHLLAGQHDLGVGWESESMDAALFVARTFAVDLVMVGLLLGTIGTIELIRSLREIKPGLPVLVYSQHELHFVELALTAGADGYVTKQESPERLIEAIREVLAGRQYVSQRRPST